MRPFQRLRRFKSLQRCRRTRNLLIHTYSRRRNGVAIFYANYALTRIQSLSKLPPKLLRGISRNPSPRIRVRQYAHKLSAVFRKQAAERKRMTGVRVAREIQFRTSKKHFPIAHPAPSSICPLFSGRRHKVPPLLHARTWKVAERTRKIVAVKSRGRPSFRLLVYYLAVRVSLYPFTFSSSFSFILLPARVSVAPPCLTFLRVFNWLPFRRVRARKL